jgi:His-Xaa-Ser system radical SAM maturase HxsC
MLKLYGRLAVLNAVNNASYLVTVTKNANLPLVLRKNRALLTGSGEPPKGFKALLTKGEVQVAFDIESDVFQIPDDYDYLHEGDIIRLDPTTGSIRSLYRRNSLHNTILLTEQCNHYCLMCSQPPKNIDDSWLLREAFELISLMPKETVRIGFSGGEPTLYGERLIELLHHTKRMLPHTTVDILSNGRAFKDMDFTRKYAAIEHPDMLIGIPLYSDDPVRHDYVVQSKGAFDDTIRGILNLKKMQQKVEIRIVIHKQTIERLTKTCEFIARNLLFVDHVALMGLEITGFTRANLDLLWIDPYEYKDTLSAAVSILNAYGMNASIYNHPLCTVNPDVWGNYRKSISDWKNEYLEECVGCSKIGDCGGFFSSGKQYRHSEHIKAFQV